MTASPRARPGCSTPVHCLSQDADVEGDFGGRGAVTVAGTEGVENGRLAQFGGKDARLLVAAAIVGTGDHPDDDAAGPSVLKEPAGRRGSGSFSRRPRVFVGAADLEDLGHGLACSSTYFQSVG